VKLDAFVVGAVRDTDAEAIATNEQRFAPNIKSVMTESLACCCRRRADGRVHEVRSRSHHLRWRCRREPDFHPGHRERDDQLLDGWTADRECQQRQQPHVFAAERVAVRHLAHRDHQGAHARNGGRFARRLGEHGAESAFEQKDNELGSASCSSATATNSFKKRAQSHDDKLSYNVVPGLDLQYTRIWQGSRRRFHGYQRQSVWHEQVSRNTFNTSAAGTGASTSRPFYQNFLLLDASNAAPTPRMA
jgi:hypothetical protein